MLDANFNRHKPRELHPDRVMHCHDIIYILEGGWEIGQDGIRYLLEKGDVIFLHAGHHHYGADGRLPGVSTMYLHVDCLPEDRLAPLPGNRTPVDNNLIFPVVVKAQDSITALTLFQDIIFSFWSDTPNKGVKLAALVDLLLFHLSELGNTNPYSSYKLVEDALYRIRLTPNRFFSLAELAGLSHVCSRSLSGRFKKVTGKTVHQYQLDLKLEMAYMQIQGDPGRPFKDIAFNLGFYDEFHFSRLFKRKYGFSPSMLKNQRFL